ncbi:MAG: diguanylate cyclase [Clostridia bacterium]|nr:diguanylate cyclase [Clostridia bacterium]
MRSLRSKITLLTVCITVAAVLVVTLLSVYVIRDPENERSDQLLLLLCETGERNLDYYFNSVEKSVKKIASYTEKDLDGLDDEKLEKHTDRIRAYFDEVANKTNGVYTYYYRIDPEVSGTVKGFWYTNPDGTDFTEHEVTDISQYDTEDTSELVWFTVPKTTGSATWLPPYFTEGLETEVISYNVPIYWRGTFVGVVGIEIDYSDMAELVESIHLYKSGYAFLTDKDGQLIFHPRINLAALEEEEIPTMPDGLLSESTFTQYRYEGKQKEAVWLRLSNGMRLYVSVPAEETEGNWKELVMYVFIAVGAVLLLSIILTRFFTGKITRPLKQLTAAAIQADQGNYDFALDYTGRDEVGTLTKTFKRMAGNMKENITDLNRRANVDALTSVRNKGAFTDFIEDMQEKMKEAPEGTAYAIGVFDCDDLKTVNDKYGHDKGDLYLRSASQLICKVFQHSPVFRIGGDEFAVVLRDEDLANKRKLITKFETAMEEINAAAGNLWEEVHIAMGIAVYDPQQDHSVMDTVRRADKVMYTNKRIRKNMRNNEK